MEESSAAQQQQDDQLLSEDEDTVEFEIEVVTSSESSAVSRASTPRREDDDDDQLTNNADCASGHIQDDRMQTCDEERQEQQAIQTNATLDQARATSKRKTEEVDENEDGVGTTNDTARDDKPSSSEEARQELNEQQTRQEKRLAFETDEEISQSEGSDASRVPIQQQGQHLVGVDERIPLEHKQDPQREDDCNSECVAEQAEPLEPTTISAEIDAERANLTSLEVDCGGNLTSAPTQIFDSEHDRNTANVDEQPSQLLVAAHLDGCDSAFSEASTNQETSKANDDDEMQASLMAEQSPLANMCESAASTRPETSGQLASSCDWQLVNEGIRWPPGWSLVDTANSSDCRLMATEHVQLNGPLQVEPAKPSARPSIIKTTTTNGQIELLSSDIDDRSAGSLDAVESVEHRSGSMEAANQREPLIRNTIDISERAGLVATFEEAPKQEQTLDGEASADLEGVPTVEVDRSASEATQLQVEAITEEAKSETSATSANGDEFQACSDDGQRLSGEDDNIDQDDTCSNVGHARHSIGSDHHQQLSKLALDRLSSSSSLHLLNSEAGSLSANLDDEDLEREFDEEPEFQRRNVQVKRNKNPRDEYELGAELGRGKFGTVVRCTELSSGLKLAAKFIHMRRREDREDVEREVAIMSVLQHKRLLQLYDAFDDGNQEMCLITELVEGGELFERIVDDDFDLTEKKAAIFMRQICEGVEYMHSEQIVHLDMKPENILCLSRTGMRIKLIDFGLARRLDPSNPIRVLFGTPDFAAPEVLAYETVTLATDMWSVGVICYVLLSGLSPFMGDSDIETMANVMRATYDFNDQAFEAISDLAKDFIAKLLVRDPATRLKPGECLKHAWLQRGGAPLEAHMRSRRESSLSLVLGAHHRLALEQAAMVTIAAAATATTSATNSTEPTPPTPPSQLSAASGQPLPGPLADVISRVSFGAESIASLGHQSLDKRRLKKYVVRRKWHKTVHAIMALGRMGANLKLA